jgi:hypothetical protein
MNKQQKLLEWIARVPTGVLEVQIVSSGLSKTLDELLRAGLVTIVEHPTVREGKIPASAVVLRNVAAQERVDSARVDAPAKATRQCGPEAGFPGPPDAATPKDKP